MAKYKHLSREERYEIQHMLNQGESFARIAKKIGRDRTTISKEVRSHFIFKKSGSFNAAFNDCKFLRHCDKASCKLNCYSSACRDCNKCIKHCSKYEKKECKRHSASPYVCNGCSKRSRCNIEKRVYSASYAQQEYELTMKETRRGISITESEALSLDAFLSPLIKKGQSIHHICMSSPDEVMFSERTLYRYVDLGLFSAHATEHPRKVKFRPRRSRHDGLKIDKACRVNRTYKDFKDFMRDFPDTPVVEIDSVIGTKGGKCLLTMHFVSCSFMLAFLRERNTAASVTAIFNSLYDTLGYESFCKLFPVILTDNGSEFTDPLSIEVDEDGVIRTRVFYCDPSSPYQKGAAENNHEFIRRILPKGASFEGLSQSDIDLMMNHINSYKRENLAGRSPYETFEFFYGRDILDKLGARLISPNDITLRPSLLG